MGTNQPLRRPRRASGTPALRLVRILGVFACLLTSALECRSQIQKVAPTDSSLYEVIESYILTRKVSAGRYGVLLVELRVEDSLLKPIESLSDYERYDLKNLVETPTSYSVRIDFTDEIGGIKLNPPDFYLVYEDFPVLVFTGMNFLITRSKKEIEKFERKLRKLLPKDHRFELDPRSMDFFVRNGKITSYGGK